MLNILKHSIYYKFKNSVKFINTFGFLLIAMLLVQSLIGIILVLGLTNSSMYFKYMHFVLSSVIVLFMYLHIYKNFYYCTLSNIYVITMLVTIFSLLFILLFMCFSGYVIPWNQISIWGFKVVTSYVDFIPIYGYRLKFSLWGGFGVVEEVIHNRILNLHIFGGFILLGFVVYHLYLAHKKGSLNSPNKCIVSEVNSSNLYSNAFVKYLFLSPSLLLIILYICTFDFKFGLDILSTIPGNLNEAPLFIKPEWFFLPSFGALKYCFNTLFGYIFSILILLCCFTIIVFKYLFIRYGG